MTEEKRKAVEIAEKKFRYFESAFDKIKNDKNANTFNLGKSLGKMMGAKYTWIALKDQL